MHTKCTVKVDHFLSEAISLTRHDPLAFSSPNTQVGAYRVSLTPFTIRL